MESAGGARGFARGGPPWDLVVYDFVAQNEQVLTSFNWSGNTYDGRIAWSEDGTQLAFSEESGGHRVIGLVHTDGSGRSSFAPDPATDYDEACFFTVASPAIESLYVAEHGSAGSQLRAYPLAAGPGDPGRLVRQPTLGAVIHSLDAAQLPIVIRPSVAFVESESNFSSVLSTTDTGNGIVTTAVSGAGVRTQVRWAIQWTACRGLPTWTGRPRICIARSAAARRRSVSTPTSFPNRRGISRPIRRPSFTSSMRTWYRASSRTDIRVCGSSGSRPPT